MYRLTVLLMLLTMCFSGSACSTDDATVAAKILELETALQKELPIGSSPEKVIRFLQSRAIEHSVYQNPSPQITGIIRDVKKGLLTSTSVQLEFFFSENDNKLIEYKVSEVFTGL